MNNPYPPNPYRPPQPVYYAHPPGPRPLPFVPGDFVLRFLAWFLDGVIVFMITIAIMSAIWTATLTMGFFAGRAEGMILAGLGLWMVSIPLAVFTFFAYHVKFETGTGQATLGKRLFGLKIYDQNGGPISSGQSIGRLLTMVFLSSAFLGVGYFIALFPEKKQALHDLVAGTVVVKA